MSPSFADSGSSEPSFLFSGIIIAEERDGVSDKGWEISQHLINTDCWICLWIHSWGLSVSSIKLFAGQKQNFWSWITLFTCQISKLSRLSDNRLKEFCYVILYCAQIFILKMYLILSPALYTVCRMNAVCLQTLYEVAKRCTYEFPDHKFYYVYKCFKFNCSKNFSLLTKTKRFLIVYTGP